MPFRNLIIPGICCLFLGHLIPAFAEPPPLTECVGLYLFRAKKDQIPNEKNRSAFDERAKSFLLAKECSVTDRSLAASIIIEAGDPKGSQGMERCTLYIVESLLQSVGRTPGATPPDSGGGAGGDPICIGNKDEFKGQVALLGALFAELVVTMTLDDVGYSECAALAIMEMHAENSTDSPLHAPVLSAIKSTALAHKCQELDHQAGEKSMMDKDPLSVCTAVYGWLIVAGVSHGAEESFDAQYQIQCGGIAAMRPREAIYIRLLTEIARELVRRAPAADRPAART